MTERARLEADLDERTTVRRNFAHLILDVLETAGEDKVEQVKAICKGFVEEPAPAGPNYESLMQ